jgi:hypothetical protein
MERMPFRVLGAWFEQFASPELNFSWRVQDRRLLLITDYWSPIIDHWSRLAP